MAIVCDRRPAYQCPSGGVAVAADGIGTTSTTGIVRRPAVSAVCLSPSVYRRRRRLPLALSTVSGRKR